MALPWITAVRLLGGRVYLCERCGCEMIEHHCKIRCPNCGYIRDCSDPRSEGAASRRIVTSGAVANVGIAGIVTLVLSR